MEMKIMQPITVGGITLKNRIMFPPLTTGYEERDGSIGEQSRAFYTLSLIHISLRHRRRRTYCVLRQIIS